MRCAAAALLLTLALPATGIAGLSPDELALAKKLARECAIMEIMLEDSGRYRDRISRARFLRALERQGAGEDDLRQIEETWETARASASQQPSAKDIWIRRIKIYVKACHGKP